MVFVVLLLMIIHDLILNDGTYTLPNDDCYLTGELIFKLLVIFYTIKPVLLQVQAKQGH